MINVHEDKHDGMWTWKEFLGFSSDVSQDDLVKRQGELQFDDPINIQFTSGTTGNPKGATLTHHNILNNGYFVGESQILTEKDRLVIPVPLYHCFGMVMGNLGCITHGSTMIYPGEGFEPKSVLQAVHQEKATALYGVPTMFIAELTEPEFETYDLSSLRTGIMAGSICPAEVMKKVNGKMNMKEVQIAYGMTETSPVSTQTSSLDPFEKQVTTVGRTQPHLETKIVDPGTGNVVPRGEIGELCTRGSQTAARIGQFFSTISKKVRKEFNNQNLIKILEFPVLFLGAKPTNTPSFYSFMNYADFGLGTWHPKGGMYEVIRGIQSLAESLGVKIKTNSNVSKIEVENNAAKGLYVNDQFIASDIVLSGADYHHSEQLLPEDHRQYSEKYWESRTFAPSALLFYVGFDKKLEDTAHHSLFFDTDFDVHAKNIYDDPKWPENPLFYASFPSVTDDNVAPEGNEAGIFLIPLAPDIADTPELRDGLRLTEEYQTSAQRPG